MTPLPPPTVSDACIGAGMCESVASAVFRVDDDTGESRVLVDGVSPADADAVRAAVASCPVKAIAWAEGE